MNTSLYVHIPFCRKKCIYCDFYSAIYENDLASSYVNSVLKETETLNGGFFTIYVGGGTPTVLSKDSLARLLNALKRFVKEEVEFTVEANPESADIEKMKLFLDSGVNRVSIGVQSLRNQKLSRLGRVHDAGRGEEAVNCARKAGFKNISMDMIFGIWDEEMDRWEKELKGAVNLPVQHISCYGLTYEKTTPLWNAVRSGSVKPLEEDIVAKMYERAIDILSFGGFKQYEVSNFARGGFRSKHNLNYWDNNPYVGLGPSAVSYIDDVRSENVSDVKDYIRRVESGRSTIVSSEKLSPARRAKETAAVKIRTKDGIDFEWFKSKTGFDFLGLEKKALPKLIEAGLVKYIKKDNIPSGICLRRKGFLFADAVSSALV